MPTVLMLSANPIGTDPLRLDEERREVEAGLIERSKLRDNFKLVIKSAVRIRDVQRALLDHQPHILHFSGHGAGAKGLVLEDEIGEGKEVSGEAIAPLFALFKDLLQCVLLNSCYSEVQAKAISEHIPFVIGMSDELDGKAAIEFAVAFYDAIGAGRDIRFAFDLATVAIKLAGINQAHVPVLLSRERESKPLPTSATISFSTYNPDTFTGRNEETRVICEQLQKGCRVVAIVGMTGVGKTALAERAIAKLVGDDALPYVRFSLDDRSIGTDFSSGGAMLLRELGDEPSLEDQKDPANLVGHIVSRLQSYPCRLQIDSMERLLQGDEQDGWSEFCDPLWLSLFQRVLSSGQCGSQVILTTQDVPGELEGVGDRFNQLWHCQTLQGLSQQEQVELFRKLGVVDEGDRLRCIGEFYDGHPLVLQVIADEIKQRPFNGSVEAYWERYGEEFGGATPARVGDRSRIFRTRVRQRVEQTIETLPESAKQLLSACSVFHRPVPETFWIEMGEGNDPYVAFDLLKGRNLVEYVDVAGQASLVRLHNLIRSVAYESLRKDLEVWERAERKAADLWLRVYVAPDDALRIESVRGYLEAFDHFCVIEDWNKASEIYTSQLSSTNQALHWQLLIWSDYRTLIEVSQKLGNNIFSQVKRTCLNQIGNSYRNLGKVEKAIECYQQALQFTRKTGDRQGEGNALGNLGLAYNTLGQFQQAIDFYQQHLNIAEEIGDRKGEGSALCNLGLAYNNLGQYQQAINLYQQSLTIDRELEDRHGEGQTLGNLGLAYSYLGQFQQALKFHQQHLIISREINDRFGEGQALGNLGFVYSNLSQHQKAIELYQKSLTIRQEIGDRKGEISALCGFGNNYCSLSKYQIAITFYQRSLTIAQEIGDYQEKSYALGSLGLAHYSLGKFHQAIDFHQQSLVIAREIGDRRGEGELLGSLGLVHHSLGEFHRAINFNQQSLAIAKEIGNRQGESVALNNLAATHKKLDQLEEAIEFNQQALTIKQDIGDRVGEAIALNILGDIQRKLNHFPESLANIQAALEIFQKIGSPSGEAETLLNFAKLYRDLNNNSQALQFYQQYLAIVKGIGDRRGEGIALNTLGDIQRKLHQFPESLTNTQAALQIFQDIGDRANETEAFLSLAKLHHDLNDSTQALLFCQQALAIASDLGIPLKAECEELLRKLNGNE